MTVAIDFINNITAEEYRTATGKGTKNSVTLESDTGVLHYDGLNVERQAGTVPAVGDALWIDSNGGKHFYRGSTVNGTALSNAGLYFVGVVGLRRGRKVWVLHNDFNSSIRFTSCWAWEITGITYGSSNTIVFQQRGLTASGATTYTDYAIGSPLTFTPSDIDDAVSKIDTWLNSNQGGKSFNSLIVCNYHWHCAKIDGRIWVISDFGTATSGDDAPSYRQYEGQVVATSGTTSGIKSDTNMWTLVGYGTSYTTMQRVNGVMNANAIWNKSRFYAYNTNVGSPTDSLTTIGLYSHSNFTAQNCPTLYAYYGGDYDRYMDDNMIKYPAGAGAMAAFAGDGKSVCERAESITYVPRGESAAVPMFTSIHDAKTRKAHSTISVDGMNAGDWYIPGYDEIYGIFSQMTTDGNDVINKAFTNSGSSARSLSASRWVPARYYGNNAWLLYNLGCTGGNPFYSSGQAVAVALLEF